MYYTWDTPPPRQERERHRGIEQAKAEMTSLRSFEYVEMKERVTGAMARIGELEARLAREARCGVWSLPGVKGFVWSWSEGSGKGFNPKRPNLAPKPKQHYA